MKIRVKAGTVVRLPDGRTTSQKGGVYTLRFCTDAQRAALKALPGVTEVAPPKELLTTKEG